MVPVEEQETEELRRFRENWKEEVREKLGLQQDSGHPTGPPTQTSTSEAEARHSRPLQSRNDALEVYIRAVRHEQAGELEEALRLYRQAFRMNPTVDRTYSLREQKAARAQDASGFSVTSVFPEIEAKSVNPFGPEGVSGVTHTHPKLASSSDQHIPGVLARIVADFPEELSFEPEDEKAPSFLQWLPDELLVHILRHLGTLAIERFACVCRKARVITLDTAIWRLGFPLISTLCAMNRLVLNWLCTVSNWRCCSLCSSHCASFPGHLWRPYTSHRKFRRTRFSMTSWRIIRRIIAAYT
jgi:F-box protein 9